MTAANRATVVAFASLLLIAFIAPALLRAADDSKAPVVKTNLLKPTNKVDSWRFEQKDAGKGTITADGDAIAFEVTAPGTESWHVQAVQTGLDLVDGKEYVLTFKAKGSPDRQLQLNAMIDQDDWHAIGLSEMADVTKEWKEFSYPFKAELTLKGKNRISFLLGSDKGQVWLKDVTLTEK